MSADAKGNQFLKKLVSANLEAYAKAFSKAAKSNIVSSIIATLEKRSGVLFETTSPIKIVFQSSQSGLLT